MALTRAVSDFKDSVKAATTADVYLAGGAPNIVDGISISVNDSILVRSQNDQTQNGIYRVTNLGTGSNGTWVRRDDFNDYRLITPGALTFVENGTINGNVFYYIAGNVGTVNVGTTPIIFSNLYTLFAAELDVASLLKKITTYSNANVDAYLPLYTGNLSAGNVTINGNLTVNGIATITNTEYINNVEYSNLIVANTVTGSTIGNAGAIFTGQDISLTGNALANLFTANNFYTINSGQFVGYVTGAIGANTPNTGSFTTVVTTGNVNIGANINITGDIIPSANVTYNLGSPTRRFKDLYLSGSSLDLDGIKLSVKDGSFYVPSLTTAGGGQLTGYLTGAIGANIPNTGVFTSVTTTNSGQVIGYLNGPIGANLANSATFTSVNANTIFSNTFTANNSGQFIGYFTGAIGANLANSGIFTSITATTITGNSIIANNSGQIKGYLTGAIGANLANSGIFTSLAVNNVTDSTDTLSGALRVAGGAGIAGNLWAGNVFSFFYWPNGKSILDTSGSTLTVANLVIEPGGTITYGDGTVQGSRAPKLYTNWDDFILTELHPGDFYYDDGTGGIYPEYASYTQSIFLVVADDDGSGTGTFINRLLDMTIRT